MASKVSAGRRGSRIGTSAPQLTLVAPSLCRTVERPRRTGPTAGLPPPSRLAPALRHPPPPPPRPSGRRQRHSGACCRPRWPGNRRRRRRRDSWPARAAVGVLRPSTVRVLRLCPAHPPPVNRPAFQALNSNAAATAVNEHLDRCGIVSAAEHQPDADSQVRLQRAQVAHCLQPFQKQR